jgi:CelD/BcsL family acetyltransferase involved in cellulose biosynthesis
MPEALHSEWTFGEHVLDCLDDAWDDLAARAPDPFCRSQWLAPWYRAFGNEGLRPAVLQVRRGGELVAGLPMLATPHRLVGMTNVHTPVFSPLFADRAALDALAAAVARSGVGRFSIGPLDRAGSAASAFMGAARRSERMALQESTYVSPIVDTKGSFDAYRARMHGGWRTLERRCRKATREHDVVVRAIEAPENGVGFLEAGLHVEASGWKRGAGTAILSQPQTARFYREMAAGFARRHALALSGMWLDDRLVAFDLALLHGGRYWMLKTGYDEAFRHLTPGLLLRRAVVERCFATGLDAHELLGGDHPWKRMFATSDRAHCTCHGFRQLPGPLAELGWRQLRPQLRRFYRATLPHAKAIRSRLRHEAS